MTRREQARDHRGWFAIGIEGCKTEANIGTLWRSAYCLGAGFIFTIGARYRPQASDTVKAWKHIPLWAFDTVDEFRRNAPAAPVVGVELCDTAVDLARYLHPERAIYLLGPEDGSLSRRALDICQAVVAFDSAYCLNVATAGSIVMYDRQCKQGSRSAAVARRPVTAEVTGSNPVGTAR